MGGLVRPRPRPMPHPLLDGVLEEETPRCSPWALSPGGATGCWMNTRSGGGPTHWIPGTGLPGAAPGRPSTHRPGREACSSGTSVLLEEALSSSGYGFRPGPLRIPAPGRGTPARFSIQRSPRPDQARSEDGLLAGEALTGGSGGVSMRAAPDTPSGFWSSIRNRLLPAELVEGVQEEAALCSWRPLAPSLPVDALRGPGRLLLEQRLPGAFLGGSG